MAVSTNWAATARQPSVQKASPSAGVDAERECRKTVRVRHRSRDQIPRSCRVTTLGSLRSVPRRQNCCESSPASGSHCFVPDCACTLAAKVKFTAGSADSVHVEVSCNRNQPTVLEAPVSSEAKPCHSECCPFSRQTRCPNFYGRTLLETSKTGRFR